MKYSNIDFAISVRYIGRQLDCELYKYEVLKSCEN